MNARRAIVFATAATAVWTGGAVVVTAAATTSGPPLAAAPHAAATHDGSVTLTERDNGALVRVDVGEKVRVKLDNGQQWDPVRGGGQVLRRNGASGGYPSNRPARAWYIAASTGRTSLRSTTDAACLHASPPCEIPQQRWRVRVRVVSASNDSGAGEAR